MTAQIIDLSALAASDGFVIIGDLAGDNAGFSVSNTGDINGDGIDDILVSALRSDDGGYDAGAVYVIFGKAGPNRATIDLSALSASDGFAIVGDASGDVAGFSVSSGGDVNGDGFDDIIVGAIYNDDGGSNAGKVYVIFGRSGTTRNNIDLSALPAIDGFTIQGNVSGDHAGRSVSNAGDINGDGFDDLIVGAFRGDIGGHDAGEAYVIFGRAGTTRTNIDLSSLSASDGFIIVGDAVGDLAGFSVAHGGDANGDGIDDLIIGARDSDNGGIDAGEAYVIFGVAGQTRSTIDLTNLAVSEGFVITGHAAGDQTGTALSFTGDINGDGIDDLIFGAPGSDSGGTDSGTAYVVFGRAGTTRANIDLTDLAPLEGFAIFGDAAGDLAGYSVSGAGDFNGDGIDDLIIGALYSDDGDAKAGQSYVIFGKAGATRSNIDLGNIAESDGLIIIVGDAAGDYAGRSVSGAGDINGDGLDDVVVGATGGDDGGNFAGQAYVIYGRLEAGALGGTSADDFLIGTGGTDAIYGLAGDDLIYAGIGNDRLFGANGIDALFGEAGDDTLSGGDGQDKLDGGDGNDIVSGGAKGDSLRGGDGNDVLDGGADDDALQGGTGIDVLTGGEGEDKFRFRDGDTGNTIATADRITDLDQAQGERISLTLVDAIVGGADDSFTFIGTAAFGNVQGQLRYELIGGNTYVMGDTNGDGASDFMIRLDGALVLTGADFSL